MSSTLLKPTNQINSNYELFIQKTTKQLMKQQHISENEAREQAEKICGMYKHHFREYVKVV